MKIARDAATSGRPKEISLVRKLKKTVTCAEWRFSRFFIIIVTVKEPICKVIRMVSPPFGWCGRPPAVCAASLQNDCTISRTKVKPSRPGGLAAYSAWDTQAAVGAAVRVERRLVRRTGPRSSELLQDAAGLGVRHVHQAPARARGACGHPTGTAQTAPAVPLSSCPHLLPFLCRRTGAGHTSVQPKRKNSKIDNKPLRFCAIISTNISPKEMPLLWQRNNSRQNPSVCST